MHIFLWPFNKELSVIQVVYPLNNKVNPLNFWNYKLITQYIMSVYRLKGIVQFIFIFTEWKIKIIKGTIH